jgi:hypothetical protein
MKIQKYIRTGILSTAALLLSGTAQLQAIPNLIIAEFASGTQGENNSQDMSWGQWSGDCLEVPYGNGTISWDGTHYAPGLNQMGAANTGSAYLTTDITTSGNNWILVMASPGYNNWYNEQTCGVPGWTSHGQNDFSLYYAVQFDVLWDTNSTLTIDQYNTGNNWNTNWFSGLAQSNQVPNYMTEQYYNTGISISAMTGVGGNQTWLGDVNIPDAAATSWQTVTMTYSQGLPITTSAGLWFSKQGGNNPTTAQTGNFWIDNLILLAPVILPGPPTMTPPIPAAPGLAVFNATEGNSFYDRNEVIANSTSGLSWIGNPGAYYSFNLTGFPQNAAGGPEAYMFFVPNSAAEDNGPDWNETNCFIFYMQSTATGSAAVLQYKLGDPNGNSGDHTVTFTYVSGPGTVTTSSNFPQSTLTSTKLLGSYTLTFTGNDAGNVTMPDGTVGSFDVGNGTLDAAFTEGAGAYPFLVYLGGQANQASGINQAAVFGSVSSSATSLNEDFVADANGSQTLQNWSKGPTHYAAGVTLVPTNALYWVDWTLPATGYALVDSPSLVNPNWEPCLTYSPIPMFQENLQLVSAGDVQNPTTDQFFAVVKGVYATSTNIPGSLVIAFPGQSFVNGVGVTGTPTALANTAGTWSPQYGTTCVTNVFGSVKTPQTVGDVYVYALDSANRLVTSVTDTISMYSNPGMGAGFDPTTGDFLFTTPLADSLGVAMVGGIATFDDTSNGSLFGWGYASGANGGSSYMVQVVDYTQQQALGALALTYNSTPVLLH